MTDAQVRYHQMVETKRHNLATEELDKYGIDTQATTSRYVADTNAAASRYSADRHYEATRYASDQGASTQLQVAQIQAETSRYAADTQARVNERGQDLTFETNSKRLEFDRQTQAILNNLEAKRVSLEQLRTAAQNEVSRAQAHKLFVEAENSVRQLILNARSVGLSEKAYQYEKALATAKTAEAWAKTASMTYGLLSQMVESVIGATGMDTPIS